MVPNWEKHFGLQFTGKILDFYHLQWSLNLNLFNVPLDLYVEFSNWLYIEAMHISFTVKSKQHRFCPISSPRKKALYTPPFFTLAHQEVTQTRGQGVNFKWNFFSSKVLLVVGMIAVELSADTNLLLLVLVFLVKNETHHKSKHRSFSSFGEIHRSLTM